MEHQSDKSLAERIRLRDHDACVQLVREHHAAVYRLLFHLCRDEHRAEDLAQETFASAWTAIGSFSGASSLATWLHTIAYRKFLDAERRRTPAVGAAGGDAADEFADDRSPDPVAIAMVKENERVLYDAIDRLPAQERDVVVMHFLQGLSYEQISNIVGTPSGTLRWRKSQAIERLRELLNAKARL